MNDVLRRLVNEKGLVVTFRRTGLARPSVVCQLTKVENEDVTRSVSGRGDDPRAALEDALDRDRESARPGGGG